MSAAELIEQIKALSPAELEIVRKFVVNGNEPSGEGGAIKYLQREEARELGAKIMEDNNELFRRLSQ